MCEKNYPFFATGVVSGHRQEGHGIFRLDIAIPWCCGCLSIDELKPGQFFILRKPNSTRLLGRPISVFSARRYEHGSYYYGEITFYIQNRGAGTEELTSSIPSFSSDEKIELLGPLGNGFPIPDPWDKACVIGGGMGFAPIYPLFLELFHQPDYWNPTCFACFKNSYYCRIFLDDIASGHYAYNYSDHSYEELMDYTQIVTEDGSKGAKGMLPDVLDAKRLKDEGYTVVYACGPEPMLKYVQSICKEAGVKSYLSVEQHMACGMGACLGCTIKTTEGNKRCCKDGPVFPGEILLFDKDEPKPIEKTAKKAATSAKKGKKAKPDTSVEIAGVKFKNPVIAASGTFGYGVEYERIIDLDSLGGICSKGLTLELRAGNDGNRIHELTSVGLMNSIGLENPGIESFIEHKLPQMLALDTVTIANLSGSSADTYIRGAMLLDKTDVDMIELNISCPNVKAGGMAFGMTPEDAGSITKQVRNVTAKPLIVKLTPNAPDLVGVALAVKGAGADAISLVNTFQALAIDIEVGKPVFDNVCAGYSGPGIKPIALRMVRDVAKAVHAQDPDYPIIGLGGISTWQDAIEFIMAGATAIQVGTATFANPNAMNEIIQGIEGYMKEKGFTSLADFRGII